MACPEDVQSGVASSVMISVLLADIGTLVP
jgi:hypothetical protein